MTPKIRRGHLPRAADARAIVDLAYVTAHARDSVVRLVDARGLPAYNGAPGTAGFRPGHIPGALSLPSASLTDSTDHYLPADSLRTRFARAGVQPGQHLIAYCSVGRSACPLYVAARVLGYDVRLYDGSYEEWSRHLELPIEGKPAK